MQSENTLWVLISTALVLLMTPGLAFFYGGLARERHAVNTIKMSLIALGVVVPIWALIGYSLAFAPGNAFLGGLEHVGLAGLTLAPGIAGEVPDMMFMAFQMTFAVITPALISGAVVGRMRFRAWLPFVGLWSLVVYAPLARWAWGPGGWLAELGALDFAGGTVVHVSSGVAALVAAYILGPRSSALRSQADADQPHNVPFVVLGAALLWFGWIGFNAGSALAVDGIAVLAAVNTILAGAVAMLVWVILELVVRGRSSGVGAAIGTVVGLVAITPAAGFVSPLAALAIGTIAAPISYTVVAVLRLTRVDDALDVFACHGVGGVTGALLTGVFAQTELNPAGADGLLSGGVGLVGVQAIGVLAAATLAAVGTAGILLLLRRTIGIRVSTAAEAHGLDVVEHAENAYASDRRSGRRLGARREPLEDPAAISTLSFGGEA